MCVISHWEGECVCYFTGKLFHCGREGERVYVHVYVLSHWKVEGRGCSTLPGVEQRKAGVNARGVQVRVRKRGPGRGSRGPPRTLGLGPCTDAPCRAEGGNGSAGVRGGGPEPRTRGLQAGARPSPPLAPRRAEPSRAPRPPPPHLRGVHIRRHAATPAASSRRRHITCDRREIT